MKEQTVDLATLKLVAENTLNLSNPTKNLKLKPGQILKEWNRNYVVRFEIAQHDVALKSVIVKQVKQISQEWFVELAALQFLSKSELAPRYLGHDLENGLIIMEDMGAAPLLQDFLQGADQPAAEQALLAMAKLVARLHGFSVQRQAEYRQIVQQLPSGSINLALSQQQSQAYRGWVERLEPWLVKLGLSSPASVLTEHNQIAARLATPGSLEVFTHGDLAPSQIIYTASGPKLLDFEYAGFRHAFYDTLSWQIICPYPPAIITKLNEVYQAELDQFIYQANIKLEYTKDYLAYCSLDLLRSLVYLLPAVWEQDKPWPPDLTGRQGALYKLQTFSRYSREFKQNQALGEFFNRVREILAELWQAESTNIMLWNGLKSHYN